jgi:hypothetical protein
MLEKLLLHAWQVFALRSVLALQNVREVEAITTTTNNSNTVSYAADLPEEGELSPLYSGDVSGGGGRYQSTQLMRNKPPAYVRFHLYFVYMSSFC